MSAIKPPHVPEELFNAYNAAVKPGVTHDGRQVPPWPHLTEQVWGKWDAAAQRAAELARAEIVNPDALEFRTASGELVACVLAPVFPGGGPRVIFWGSRVFVRELLNPAEYREAFAWAAPAAAVLSPPPSAQD